MARELALLKDPDEREAKFIAAYIDSGDEENAFIAAGYVLRDPKAAAKRLLAQGHIAWALAIAVRKRLASSAPMALRALEDLASAPAIDATTKRVKLEAAKALLDRAGHVAPRATLAPHQADKPLHEQTTGELQALAARLEDELAGRAKPVTGADSVPKEAQAIDLVG